MSDIDNMPAGREMDALIAEKVMGWRVHFRNTAWWVKAEDEKEAIVKKVGFACGNDRFMPSTDIAAAWKVAEKVGEKYDCVIFRDRDTDKKPYCQFVYCDNGDEDTFEEYIAEAETVPLAICRAALKAVTP